MNELAHELGVSRRLLKLRFSQFERRTAAEALDDRRYYDSLRLRALRKMRRGAPSSPKRARMFFSIKAR